MSNQALRAVFDAAKRVYADEVTRSAAAADLHRKYGINENSARDLIDGYKHLRRGEVFKRAFSAPDLDYYLGRIGGEHGEEGLRAALAAAWLHIAYYEGKRKLTLRKLREVVALHQAAASLPAELEDLDAEFRAAVASSLADSRDQRRNRLKSAPRQPARTARIVIGYARNPDVVAEVLSRAAGMCEGCKRPAPFMRRSDGSPYLEVHHVQQLSEGGEDTVENALALCPNCHRNRHYGAISVLASASKLRA